MAIKGSKFINLLFLSLFLICSWVSTPLSAWASNQSLQGAALFELHCAGCHPQGGNIIRRGKTLKQKALQANHVETPEAIATIIANGKGNMTAFGDRLTAEQIAGITDYVMAQASLGWKG